MKKNLLIAGAMAAILSLAFCLVGCGQNETYLKIDGETFSVDMLSEKAKENAIAAEQYIGQPFEAVATVSKVHGKESVNYDNNGSHMNRECENGYVSLEGRLLVEISSEYSEIASQLNEGDTVKVTGTVTGYSDYGSFVNVLALCRDRDDNEHPVSIEKL